MKKIGVASVEKTGEFEDVFDIEVENEHHYILENGVVSHNSGPIFAASIVALMNKFKLKEDEDGNKVKEVLGIRSKFQVVKSRFSKPFESVEIMIPWDTGMDKFSGLVDMFEKADVLVKDGNKLKYIALDGTEHKYFRKQWRDSLLEMIINEYPEIERRRDEARIKAGLPEETFPEHLDEIED